MGPCPPALLLPSQPRQRLDMYLTKNRKPGHKYPVVIFITGGGTPCALCTPAYACVYGCASACTCTSLYLHALQYLGMLG